MQSFGPPTRGGLHDDVHDHLSYMASVVVEGPPRPRSLRASSLPYCPILDTLDPRAPERGELSMGLYSAMGTAAHAVVQQFATVGAPGAKVWGCWKCPRCAREWRECFRPAPCPTGCNDAPLYVEMSYRLQIASAHSDLVVQYPRGWCVHEYKTCGQLPREPDRKHVLQARTYCHMLRKLHRISPSYVIVYIERQHLRRRVFGPYDATATLQQMGDWTNRSVAGFRAASLARRSPTAVNLTEVARCRPCHDQQSFESYMSRDKYRFVRGKPCELLGVCSTDNDVNVARVMREVLEGR